MINEDISKKVMQEIKSLATYMMNIAKEQAGNTNQLSEFLRKKIKSAYKNADNPLFSKNNSEMKLKDLYKQGQLEQVNIRKGEIKNIRKELNRYAVKFSVMKDKANGDFVVFFQAKDTKMIDLAFRQVFLKAKEISKPSIIQAIKHYKQQAQSHQRQKQQELGKITRVKLPSKDKHLER